MHQSFRNGFEKTAIDGASVLAGLGVLGALGGLGALAGAGLTGQKKVIHARQGKDYTPESFIERHPVATGALSLGMAPALSQAYSQMELDRENPKVRQAFKEHPLATAYQASGMM